MAQLISLLRVTDNNTGDWNLSGLTTRSPLQVSVSMHTSLVLIYTDLEDTNICPLDNYVYRTSGRSPALSGKTLFHAVNSVWENNNGHAIEGTDDGQGLFEGCVFNNISQIVGEFVGQLFSSPSDTANKACSAALKRDCVTNIQVDSGPAFTNADTKFFSNFAGLNVATASAASAAQASVPTSAGNTLNNA